MINIVPKNRISQFERELDEIRILSQQKKEMVK